MPYLERRGIQTGSILTSPKEERLWFQPKQ